MTPTLIQTVFQIHLLPQPALAPLFEATTKAGSQPRLTAEDLVHIDILKKGQTWGCLGLDLAVSFWGLDAAPIYAASPAVNFSTLADVIGHVNPQKSGPNELPNTQYILNVLLFALLCCTYPVTMLKSAKDQDTWPTQKKNCGCCSCRQPHTA